MPSQNSHLTLEEIAALVDGGLAKSTSRNVLSHVATCSECAAEYFLGVELRDREQAGLPSKCRAKVVQKFQTLIGAGQEADPKGSGGKSFLVGLIGMATALPRSLAEPALAAHSLTFGEREDGGVRSDEHSASVQPEGSNSSSPNGGTHM